RRQRSVGPAGVAVSWDEPLAGLASIQQGGLALPEAMLRSVRETGLALKTKLLSLPASAAKADGPVSARTANFNIQFRRALGLFASVRPVKNLPGLPARFQNVDLLIIREITEDLDAAIRPGVVPGGV